MTIRYLTFDCYGTLIDWRRGIEKSLADTFGRLPLHGDALMKAYVAEEKLEEATYQKYREVLRKTALRLSERLGLRATEGSATRFANSVPSWPAFPDTAKVVGELGTRGYRRYILSNVDIDILKDTIRRSRLEIDGFVTAEEVGSYKPAHGHWLRFMEETGAAKSEVLHVAQSLYHDILPAEELGINSVWVNRYGDPPLPQAHPTYVVATMAEVAELLE